PPAQMPVQFLSSGRPLVRHFTVKLTFAPDAVAAVSIPMLVAEGRLVTRVPTAIFTFPLSAIIWLSGLPEKTLLMLATALLGTTVTTFLPDGAPVDVVVPVVFTIGGLV